MLLRCDAGPNLSANVFVHGFMMFHVCCARACLFMTVHAWQRFSMFVHEGPLLLMAVHGMLFMTCAVVMCSCRVMCSYMHVITFMHEFCSCDSCMC